MATLAGRGSGQTYPFPGGLGPELFEPHFLRYGQEPAWASGATYLKHPGTRQEVEALREVLGRGGEAIREEVSDALPPPPPPPKHCAFLPPAPSSSRMPGATQNGLFGFFLSTRTCLWPFSQSHGMWVLPRKKKGRRQAREMTGAGPL